MPRSLPALLARAAGHRQRTAIIDRTGTFTYADLERESSRLAGGLLRRRTALHERRVAYLVSPGLAHVALQWGVWRAGGIAVPLPLTHPPAELESLVRDADASAVVADQVHADTGATVARACGAPFSTLEELRAKRHAVLERPVALSGRAMILYTSGTTGRPKGVVTTHAQIAAQIESLVRAWAWTADDRTLLVLPLHHVHGIINVIGCALWSGAAVEVLDRFDAEETWARLASGQLTVFTAVPTIYHRLVHAWERCSPPEQRRRSEAVRTLRLMMSGSAALPRTLLERWEAITGHVLLERYGMTELGMALSNPLQGHRRPGYVGAPLPGVQTRIVDGELQVKGPGVFREYWRQPDATREAFVDGWFRTGDTAVSEDGVFRLLGRTSVDILKTGGDKISALEIEEVLRTHPAVHECAVIGVDDAEWGQKVCCAVELRPGSALELSDLKTWARGRLAPQKIPKALLCLDQLPRNAMGKIVKPELVRLFARPAPPAPQAS